MKTQISMIYASIFSCLIHDEGEKVVRFRPINSKTSYSICMERFEGKVVGINGAASGIGLQFDQTFGQSKI